MTTRTYSCNLCRRSADKVKLYCAEWHGGADPESSKYRDLLVERGDCLTLTENHLCRECILDIEAMARGLREKAKTRGAT